MSSIAELNVRLGMEISQFERNRKKAKRNLKATAKEFKELGNSMTMNVSVPVLGFLGRSAQLWDKQAQAIAQVETGVKSTGAAAGFSVAQLGKMASEIQDISTIGDEDILKNLTANMLTFTKVTGEQFKRAQVAAADLSTRMGTDLKSAALQVGKALNDPTKGLTALSRSGIQFSEAQKETIKQMMATNRVAEAQNIILKELETQFGGSAKAAAEAGLGPMRQFQNTMGDLMETLGKGVIPLMNEGAKRLKNFMEVIMDTDEETRNLAIKIGLVAAAIGPTVRGVGMLITTGMKLKGIYIGLTGAISIATNTMKVQTAQAAAGTIGLSKMQIAVNGLKTAWVRMDLATKATAIGAVVAAIGAAVIAFNKWKDSMSSAARTKSMLNDVTTAAQKNIVTEKLEAEKLINVIKDGNAERKEQIKALDRLKQINSDYFGQLSIEKSSVEQITAAYDGYISNLLKAAKIKAAEQQIIELEKERLDLINKLKDPSVFQQVLSKAGSVAYIIANDTTARIKQQIKEIEQQQQALAAFSAENDFTPNTTITPNPTNEPIAQGRKLIEVPDLLPSPADIIGSYQMLADALKGSIETSIPQVKTASGEVKNVLTALGEQYESIEDKNLAFGTSFNTIPEKIEATKVVLSSLLTEGVSPFSSQVTFLREQLAMLEGQLDTTTMKWQGFGEGVQAIIESGIEDTLINFSENLGVMLAGMASGADGLKSVVGGLADILAKVGRLAIQTGIVVEGIKTALKSLNPALAIAGGAALIALSKVVKSSLAKSVPAFAAGGIVTGETLAMVGDNPSGKEMILPLEKAPEVFGNVLGSMGGGGNSGRKLVAEISGDKMLFWLEEIRAHQIRSGGPRPPIF
ncbi:MAG: phage tail length tape measure family protein [Bacteroidota bacterium]